MNTEYFESAELSDVGRKRKNNEDSCLRIPEAGLYCVADGMGGVAGGDIASEAVTSSLQKVFGAATPEELAALVGHATLFRTAVNQASQWIKRFADEKVVGQMGSTVVGLLLDPRNPARAISLHAGDSRLYRFRGGALQQLTTDHSAFEALLEKTGLDPASLPAKYQNELTRAVGLKETVELERTRVDVLSGDVLLLCSDGLSRMVSDDAIAALLKKHSSGPIADAAHALVSAANEAGGKDNVTVVLLKVGDISAVSRAVTAEEEEEFRTPAEPPADTEATATAVAPERLPETSDPAEAEGQTPETDDPTPNDKPTQLVRSVSASVPKKATPASSAAAPVQHSASGKKVLILVAGVLLVALAAAWWVMSNRKTGGSVGQPFDAATVPQEAAPPVPAPPAAKVPPAPIPPREEPPGDVAFQAALKAGHDAILKKDFQLALAKATDALAAKPGEASAVALKTEAEQQLASMREAEQKFLGALGAAQEALKRNDYGLASAKAGEALSQKPGDAQARAVKADAEKQLVSMRERDQKFQSALGAARDALNRKDYAAVLASAAEALGAKPGDAQATAFKAEAEKQLAMIRGMEQKYQTALGSAKEALAKRDFAAVSSHAAEILQIRPGDPQALEFQKQAAELPLLERATGLVAAGQYDQALAAIGERRANEVFKALLVVLDVEKAALGKAQQDFSAGSYGFLDGLKAQNYAAKKPFATLVTDGTKERQMLAELEGAKARNDWKTVQQRLNDPTASGVAGKPPFRTLLQWSQSFSDESAAVAAARTSFEMMLVQFRVKRGSDPSIESAEAKAAVPLDGGMDLESINGYLAKVKAVEDLFKKRGELTPERVKNLKQLRDAINSK